jgi:hypothetical protein
MKPDKVYLASRELKVHLASKELDIVFGADFILRVNIDGICVMRVWLDQGCEIAIRNDLPHDIGLQKVAPC